MGRKINPYPEYMFSIVKTNLHPLHNRRGSRETSSRWLAGSPGKWVPLVNQGLRVDLSCWLIRKLGVLVDGSTLARRDLCC